MKNKENIILDACCGGRMFWFNKNNKKVLFIDNRKENHKLCDGREFNVKPDIKMDFRKLNFKDKTFKMVVFDPPHLIKIGEKSWMAKKYGKLNDYNWKNDLEKGFSECWRVLEDFGILIFKWNERDVSVKEILNIFHKEPLFGHTTGRSGKTKWICFMKS